MFLYVIYSISHLFKSSLFSYLYLYYYFILSIKHYQQMIALIDLLYHPIHAILLSVQILIGCPFG
jgi:hypothetical protein